VESCPECKGTNIREMAELVIEPFEGKTLEYGTRYLICQCRVSWYSRSQMREQMWNRERDLR
jgi:hypothetical protein